MTLTQTVEIPANRRITLDLDVPPQIPTGSTAQLELIWFPQKKKPYDFKASLARIQELCKDAPVSTETLREERRRDLELEQQKNIRLYGEKI
jgi:hypothetical protein